MAETREIIVRNQQGLEDVALEHYGGVEGVMNLLLENREILPNGFNSELYAGMVLRVSDEPVNTDMRDALARLGVHPVSDENTGVFIPDGPDFDEDFNDDVDSPGE